MGNSSSVSKKNITETKKMSNNENGNKIANRACFGAGCYWGTEKYFKHNFPNKSAIVQGLVGFMGNENSKSNPSYQEVCSGTTGHVEVYDFEFNGDEKTYEEIVKFFFQFHDPTTFNSQGNDHGTQYASVIFCYDETQKRIAEKVKNELQQLLNANKITAYKERNVTTDIRMATKFYPAHKEHQEYLLKNPNGYCNHRLRFPSWPTA